MALTRSTAEIDTLIHEISSTATQAHGNIKDNAEARKMLLAAAQALFWSLESPSETFWRLTMQWLGLTCSSTGLPAVNATLRTAVEIGLLDSIVKSHNGTASAKELSANTGHDQLLIVRVPRLLSTVGVVREVGPETYQATEICHHLGIPNVKDGVKHLYDDSGFALMHLPSYLKKNGFKNPEDHANAAFQQALDTKLGLFPWLKEHPERFQAFSNFMTAHRTGRPLWFTFFPVQEKLIHGLQDGDAAALIVDVGGGMGHDLAAFTSAFPTARGRLVLQDLPETIEAVASSLDASVERMAHDFFMPQPIKGKLNPVLDEDPPKAYAWYADSRAGARAYYFSTVLHDWPDSSCQKILRNIAAVMIPGYSRLLINDFALPDMNCPSIAASFDLNMMAVAGGMERTRTQWQNLLASAGLEVVKYWTYEGGEFDGIIEAKLKDTE